MSKLSKLSKLSINPDIAKLTGHPVSSRRYYLTGLFSADQRFLSKYYYVYVDAWKFILLKQLQRCMNIITVNLVGYNSPWRLFSVLGWQTIGNWNKAYLTIAYIYFEIILFASNSTCLIFLPIPKIHYMTEHLLIKAISMTTAMFIKSILQYTVARIANFSWQTLNVKRYTLNAKR